MESPVLDIRLFGDLEVRYGERVLPPFESSRVESLLAYLLLHRDAPQPRQRIAFLLWPDSSEGQARTNLRHLLHTLRQALPEPERFIDITTRTLQWRDDAPSRLDVAEFERAIERGELRAAVDLYRGDLLPGCYDEWIAGDRDRLRQAYLLALEQLTRALETEGDHLQAILYACKLQLHDPLYEETYRLLMRLHAARGDRARAVRVYHECATTLERELGVEPSRPTREAYEALLSSEPELPARQREQGQRARTQSPLIGRAGEWDQLTACWRATETGSSRFVLISGEAGVGKTRLVEEFRGWCDQRGSLVAEARSYAAEGALSFGPIVEWLRSEALRTRRGRLDRTTLAVLARLLPEIHAEHPGLPAVEALSETDLRQQQFGALAGALHATSMPVLLVLDDIHWSDRETLQFLHFLLRSSSGARLLVVATARREEVDDRHPLHDLLSGLHALERLTEINLERLTRAETADLAEQTTGQSLTEQHADRLFEETEGNPLFIVEALRAGWATSTEPGRWISPRVQAVIGARLGQLSAPAGELVGVAATIGREFSTDVLGGASGADDETLVRGLDELWRRRIIREQGIDAYDFTHDKIREVAYLNLSPAQRRRWHLRVAQALEQLHRDNPDPVSGQLAGHYEGAGALAEALDWYARAAGVAQRMHANIEAVRLLEHALDLVGSLPETPERQRRELAILAALPGPLVATQGYFASRVIEVHERALQIARALGVELAPPLTRSLALANLSRYEFEPARRFGEELRAHGEREGDHVLLAQSGYVLGITAFWQGEFQLARRHFEAAVRHCRPEDRPTHFLHYGHDPESTCLMRLGCTLWFLGHPQAAASARDAAIRLTGEFGHLYSRRLVLMFAAVLALEMRDTRRVREHVVEMLDPSIQEEAIHVRGTVEVFAGYAEVLENQPAKGIARILQALDDPASYEQAPGQIATFLRVLLDACWVAGDVRTGLAASERLLQKNRGVRLWDAEAHRFHAEFMALSGAPADEVTAELEQAMDIAHRQEARSLELRAATSLLNHHLKVGDERGAGHVRERLLELCHDLDEHAGTPDMRAALHALSLTQTAPAIE